MGSDGAVEALLGPGEAEDGVNDMAQDVRLESGEDDDCQSQGRLCLLIGRSAAALGFIVCGTSAGAHVCRCSLRRWYGRLHEQVKSLGPITPVRVVLLAGCMSQLRPHTCVCVCVPL